MNRKILFLAGGLLVVSAAGSFVVLKTRAHAREQAIVASVPTRPDLSKWPAEMVRLIATCEEICRDGPDRLESAAKLAQVYHANGFLPEAVQLYRGLARAQPENALWLHRLASIFDSLGRLDDAVPLWERAARLAPRHLPIRIHLADALLKLERYDQAAREYEAVLKEDADNAYASFGLARLDVKQGRLKEARDRLEKSTRSRNNALGADLLVSVYDQLGMKRQADAMRAQSALAGGFVNIPDPWIDDIYEDCYDPYRLLLVGSAADYAGKPEKVLKYLERAARLAPNYAIAQFQLAMFHDRNGRMDTALQYARRCVELAPDFADGWIELISLQRRKGDDATADRLLDAALAHSLNSPSLHMENGKRLAREGKIEEAIGQYRIAVRLRPEEAAAHVEIAKLLFGADRVPEGGAELEAALAAEPGHPLAISTLTLHWIMSGNEAKAAKMFEEMKQQPRITDAQRADLAKAFRDRFGHEP